MISLTIDRQALITVEAMHGKTPPSAGYHTWILFLAKKVTLIAIGIFATISLVNVFDPQFVAEFLTASIVVCLGAATYIGVKDCVSEWFAF